LLVPAMVPTCFRGELCPYWKQHRCWFRHGCDFISESAGREEQDKTKRTMEQRPEILEEMPDQSADCKGLDTTTARLRECTASVDGEIGDTVKNRHQTLQATKTDQIKFHGSLSDITDRVTGVTVPRETVGTSISDRLLLLEKSFDELTDKHNKTSGSLEEVVTMGDHESKHWLAEVFVPWGRRNLHKLSVMLDAEENPQSMTVSPFICDCNGVSGSKQKEDHCHDEDEDKDKREGTFCDQIPSKAHDRLMELEDRVKQLQATVDQFQLTSESRMQSWCCQIEQDLLQNLQDNYNMKFQALESHMTRLRECTASVAEDADKEDDEKDNKEHSPLGNGGTTDTYTWTQTLSTLEVHVLVKPGVKAKQIVCDIGVGTLKVGIKGEPLILQGEMYGKVKPDDCMWTLLDNKILQISLEKLDSRKWWRRFMQGDPEIARDDSIRRHGHHADICEYKEAMIQSQREYMEDRGDKTHGMHSMAYFIGDDADEEAKHDADHKESSFSEESSRCDESDDDVYDDEEEEHNYHDYIMDDIEREQWDQEFAEHAKLVQVNLVAP